MEILGKINYPKSISTFYLGKPLYMGELTKKPNSRKLVEQPKQQTRRKMWNEVSDTLHNLDFMQTNSNTQMINNRKENYNLVLHSLGNGFMAIGHKPRGKISYELVKQIGVTTVLNLLNPHEGALIVQKLLPNKLE
ncbi:MAG: hypothetical protein WCK09_16950 [Bacteroidota bacterium]